MKTHHIYLNVLHCHDAKIIIYWLPFYRMLENKFNILKTDKQNEKIKQVSCLSYANCTGG